MEQTQLTGTQIRYIVKASASGGNLFKKELPEQYTLYQNFPQTFYKVTRIGFDIPEDTYVKLAIYDVYGRVVGALVDSELNAGSYEIIWNACKLAPGMYYCKLIAGDFVDSKKIFLLRN
jgi:hypothetical protein